MRFRRNSFNEQFIAASDFRKLARPINSRQPHGHVNTRPNERI